jgi:hypothetical protein
MTNKSNASLLMQGYGSLVEGIEKQEGGKSQMILGWLPVLDTPLRWSVGEGADAKSEIFTAREYITKPHKDTKVKGLRMAVIGSDLLGRPETAGPMVGGLKGNVTDTLRAAIAVEHFYGNGKGGSSLSLVSLLGAGGKSRKLLAGIPARDVFDLLEKMPEGSAPALNTAGRAVLNANAIQRGNEGLKPLSATKALNDVINSKVTLGVTHAVYGKVMSPTEFCKALIKRGVAADLMPDPVSRGGSDDVGEHANKTAQATKNFSAKIEQVRDWLTMCNAPDGEVQIAPTKEQEAILDVIAEQWAAYRSAHPVLF